DDRQDRGLHELCLHDRRDYFDQRFAGEDDAPLGDRIDIPAEVESAQVMEEIFAEDPESAQIIHILIRKVQILDILYDLFQPGHDGITAFVRIFSEKHIKDNGFIFLCLEITLHHGQFVEISQQSKIL